MALKGVKETFVHIITQIYNECEIKCTQQFYADTFAVLLRKMNVFLNGNNFDYDLLNKYCAFHDYVIDMKLVPVTPFEKMMLK